MKSIRHQQGMSLIELMIAGLIGMVIAYFVMNIMMSSNRSALSSEGVSQSGESGRLVMSWLVEEVRRAGYNPEEGATAVTPFSALCAAGQAMPPAAGANCTYESTAGWNDNDRLAIHWQYTTTVTSDRDNQDCTGVALTFTSNTELTDVYWIETGNADNGYDDVLRCVTYEDSTGTVLNPAQSIASGVVGLQVQYGESMTETTDGTSNVTRYVAADEVTDWDSIQSVRIAVLTRAFTDLPVQAQDRAFVLLDADPYLFSDGVSRTIQATTIALPNRQ